MNLKKLLNKYTLTFLNTESLLKFFLHFRIVILIELFDNKLYPSIL